MFGICINYDQAQSVLDVHQFDGVMETNVYDDFLMDIVSDEFTEYDNIDAAINSMTPAEEHKGEWEEAVSFVKDQMGHNEEYDCRVGVSDNGATIVWIICEFEPHYPIAPDSVTNFLE